MARQPDPHETRRFHGCVDEVKVFNTALSAKEVSQSSASNLQCAHASYPAERKRVASCLLTTDERERDREPASQKARVRPTCLIHN